MFVDSLHFLQYLNLFFMRHFCLEIIHFICSLIGIMNQFVVFPCILDTIFLYQFLDLVVIICYCLCQNLAFRSLLQFIGKVSLKLSQFKIFFLNRIIFVIAIILTLFFLFGFRFSCLL